MSHIPGIPNSYREKQSVSIVLDWQPAKEYVPDLLHQYTKARMLCERLNNTMLVTGVMASPLFSATNLPSIACNPALCTTALVACILDTAGFLLAFWFRLGLWHKRSKGEDEIYASHLDSSQSGRLMTAILPMVLIASSMLLFLTALSGSLFVDRV